MAGAGARGEGIAIRYWWSFKLGIRNLARYGPAIWRTREYDWAYLTEILALKFRYMAEHHEQQRIVSPGRRTINQLRVCQWACERLTAARYGCDGYPFAGKEKSLYRERHVQQDIHYLTRMISKYLREWWD